MKRSKVKGIIVGSYFPTSACIFLMPELLDSKKYVRSYIDMEKAYDWFRIEVFLKVLVKKA